MNWINSVREITATTFAFSSVFILLLCVDTWKSSVVPAVCVSPGTAPACSAAAPRTVACCTMSMKLYNKDHSYVTLQQYPGWRGGPLSWAQKTWRMKNSSNNILVFKWKPGVIFLLFIAGPLGTGGTRVGWNSFCKYKSGHTRRCGILT